MLNHSGLIYLGGLVLILVLCSTFCHSINLNDSRGSVGVNYTNITYDCEHFNKINDTQNYANNNVTDIEKRG